MGSTEWREFDTARILDAVIQASPAAIAAVDEEGRVQLWNPAAEQIFGYERGEVLGQALPIIPTDSESEFRSYLQRVMDGVSLKGVEVVRQAKDGTRLDCELWTAPIRENGTIIGAMAIYHDISARKERQRELGRKSSLLDAIFDSIPVHLYVKDADGRHVHVSSEFVEDPDSLVGKTDLETGLTAEEYAQDDYEDDMRVIETGEAILDKEKYYPDPGRWYLTSKVPWRDENGEIIGLIGVSRDITERKRRERRLTRQNEQLAMLNRLIRHDIRNDMTIVAGWLDVLRDVVPEGRQSEFNRITDTIDHVVELTYSVGDVMDLVEENGDRDVTAVSLGHVLTQEIEKTRSRYERAVVELSDDVPDVDVLANAMLSSVFRNVLNNAIQHNDTDEPHVEVRVEDRNGTVVVSVADDGPGVPDGRKETIFAPDEQGVESEGMGLGLYLVSSLVGAFGGDVWVEDNEPRGAVFRVELRKAGTP